MASDGIGSGSSSSSRSADVEGERRRRMYQRYILDVIQAHASINCGIMKLETLFQRDGNTSGAKSKETLDCFLDALSALSSYFESSNSKAFWQTHPFSTPFCWDVVFSCSVEQESPMPEFDEFSKLSGYFSVIPDGLSVFVEAVAGITKAVGIISDVSKTASTTAHVSKLIADVLKRLNFNAVVFQLEKQDGMSHYAWCFGLSTPVLDTLSSICVIMKFLFDSKKSIGVLGYNHTLDRMKDMGALVNSLTKRLGASLKESNSSAMDQDIVSIQIKYCRLSNRLLDLQFEFSTWMLGCLNVRPFVVFDGSTVSDTSTLDKNSAACIDAPKDAQVVLSDLLSILKLVQQTASALATLSRDLYYNPQSTERTYRLKDAIITSFDSDALKRSLHGIISTTCLRIMSTRIQALYHAGLISTKLDGSSSGGDQKLEAVMSYLESAVDAHRDLDAVLKGLQFHRLVPKSELHKDSHGYHLTVSDIYYHLSKAYELTRRFDSADEAIDSCLRHLPDAPADASADTDRIRRRQAWALKAMLCRGNKETADKCIHVVRSLCIPPTEGTRFCHLQSFVFRAPIFLHIFCNHRS